MAKLDRIGECKWEIPKSGKMQVPGIVYATEKLVEQLKEEEALEQVINVACLPGIVKYSLAMPDIHWGYGFPIGGVAAFDLEEGIISPGGVGYDINCGVRLLSTNIRYLDIKSDIERIVDALYEAIPVGVGSKNAIPKLSKDDFKEVMKNGAIWAIENGYGDLEDLEFIEDYGRMSYADPKAVSETAIERGLPQLGTLGSGNHFLELGVVKEVYDENVAKVFRLQEGYIVIMIHTGSRGFGYQICDDFIKKMLKASERYKIEVPDKQLACVPFSSDIGKEYLAAMSCAANFAWTNRQIIMSLTERAIKKILSNEKIEVHLVYDIAHNIAKIEELKVDGKLKKLLIHRKGATRCYPANHPLVPPKYQNIGQPVLIPGDMGRYSYVCVGLNNALAETFASACHGAGRVHSRSKISKLLKGRNPLKELRAQGIYVKSPSVASVAEEVPQAYKDVTDVVESLVTAGIIKKIVKTEPLGVIKG